MYRYLLKPLFFRFDPERVHEFVFNLLARLYRLPLVPWIFKSLYTVEDNRLEQELFGLRFPNPVGLAAGFDKNAKLVNCLASLGFGFIEIGTLTPKPQPGNPKPRLFRLPEDRALINRMGFNNDGVAEAAKRLKKRKPGVLVGGNIGKNKVTPNDRAVEDYEVAFEALYKVVDYFVVNVSSPNTPQLRELQEKEPLERLLRRLSEINRNKPSEKPVLLKIAPDLSDAQLDDIVEICRNVELDGIIATNTTINREGLRTREESIREIGAGGLSGAPLRVRSTAVIRYLRAKLGPEFPIIGVGGVHDGQSALEKLEAGANLVQVYTGFIYEGPGMAKRINRHLVEHWEKVESRNS